jgi:hypothetical protein
VSPELQWQCSLLVTLLPEMLCWYFFVQTEQSGLGDWTLLFVRDYLAQMRSDIYTQMRHTRDMSVNNNNCAKILPLWRKLCYRLLSLTEICCTWLDLYPWSLGPMASTITINTTENNIITLTTVRTLNLAQCNWYCSFSPTNFSVLEITFPQWF